MEIKKIQETEEGFLESLKGNNMDLEDDERIPLTKDLTSIVEKLAKQTSGHMNSRDFQVALQEIPNTSVAVFQTIENGNEKESENMLNQVSVPIVYFKWRNNTLKKWKIYKFESNWPLISDIPLTMETFNF